MIDTITKIIDRLIQWKKHRDERAKTAFAEFIEPTFRDVSSIHNDYLQMFESVRSILTSNTESSDREKHGAARDALLQNRIQYSAQRTQIKSLAQAWRNAHLGLGTHDSSSRFFYWVSRYFSLAAIVILDDRFAGVRDSVSEILVRFLDDAAKNEAMSYDHALEAVQCCTWYVEETYRHICNAFSAAKIDLSK